MKQAAKIRGPKRLEVATELGFGQVRSKAFSIHRVRVHAITRLEIVVIADRYPVLLTPSDESAEILFDP